MAKEPRAHFPSAPDYDAPGFKPLHRGPLRGGVARLYADAGCIATPMFEDDGVTPVLNAAGKQKWHVNPSQVGVTWAWVLVGPDDEEISRASGSLLCPIIRDGREYRAVCDLSEWYAVMHGLHHAPMDLGHLEVATDNLLTIHRMFHGYPCRTIPPRWAAVAADRRKALMAAGTVLTPIHLKGHPLKHWLTQGHTGTDEVPGFPVSRWNEEVDSLCTAEARKVLEGMRAKGQEQAEREAGEAERGAELAAAV